MTLTALASTGLDMVALAVLVGALYIPRHGRRDLVAAYIGVNIGDLAVTLLLSSAPLLWPRVRSPTSSPLWHSA